MSSEEIEAHVLKKFEIIQKIGKGSRGTVWKALNKRTKEVVALKKWANVFRNTEEAQKTYNELMLLLQMRSSEGVVNVLKVIRAYNNLDLYLVLAFLETDLHSAIRAHSLEEIHRQYIVYQILKALKYLHSGQLIHRNIKPLSILINSQCQINLIGFKLASIESYELQDLPENDVESNRFYWPPEGLMGACQTSKSFDMWAVGCVLGEMILGRPVFNGVSVQNQLKKIVEVIGKPEDSSELGRRGFLGPNDSKKKTIKGVFPNVSEDALDFLKRILVFDPRNRMTLDEALKHKYLEQFNKGDSFGTNLIDPVSSKGSLNSSFVFGVPSSIEKGAVALEYQEIILSLSKKKQEEIDHFFMEKAKQVADSSAKEIMKRVVSQKKTQKEKTQKNVNFRRVSQANLPKISSVDQSASSFSKEDKASNPIPIIVLAQETSKEVSKAVLTKEKQRENNFAKSLVIQTKKSHFLTDFPEETKDKQVLVFKTEEDKEKKKESSFSYNPMKLKEPGPSLKESREIQPDKWEGKRDKKTGQGKSTSSQMQSTLTNPSMTVASYKKMMVSGALSSVKPFISSVYQSIRMRKN